VLVTFEPTTADSCRVSIAHTGWERLGADAASRRDTNRAGWDAVLRPFLAAAEA
jgi:hypothetical protein